MRSLERLALVGALAAAVTSSGHHQRYTQRPGQRPGPAAGHLPKPGRQLGAGRPQLADRGAGGRSSGRRSQERPGSSADRPRRVQRSIPRGVQLHRLLFGAVEHICGTGDGITASGAPVQAGVTVAADPDILPLGSAVYIEGVGLRYIQDTGSAVKGKALDVAVDTHSEALTWSGYGTHRVWLLEVE